tara:strand:+ start:10580 stop:10834 length:255 start_codon:yes stop_codon:yes gene_type:complete
LNAEETNNWFFKQSLKYIESLERVVEADKNTIRVANDELNKLFINEYDVEALEKIITHANKNIKESKKTIKELKEINLMAFSKN